MLTHSAGPRCIYNPNQALIYSMSSASKSHRGPQSGSIERNVSSKSVLPPDHRVANFSRLIVAPRRKTFNLPKPPLDQLPSPSLRLLPFPTQQNQSEPVEASIIWRTSPKSSSEELQKEKRSCQSSAKGPWGGLFISNWRCVIQNGLTPVFRLTGNIFLSFCHLKIF